MKPYKEIDTNKGRAKIFKGFAQQKVPKTYKEFDVLFHNFEDTHRSKVLILYKVKDGSLRYKMNLDSDSYPYFGRFEFI